ncbi:glycolate oxidase subunit GlcE [Kaarinaea lacus]
MQDQTQQLQQQVEQAFREQSPLRIVGGDSKSFYGNPSEGEILSVSGHTGIVEYEPNELVITVRAGTPLKEIKNRLAAHGQMLAFEPPSYGDSATIGGTIACGFSGPRRLAAGSARDFMLGCKVLTGKGEIIEFGGKVIKNVAGYDVSRMMVGAMGTLGVLLEISLKVLPLPEKEITLAVGAKVNESIDIMNARAGQPLPLTAACYDGEAILMRFSSTEKGIKHALSMVAGDELKQGPQFWQELNEHEHYFFKEEVPLWRLSLAPATLHLGIPGSWLFDWGGALRWLKTDAAPQDVRDAVEGEGGHVTLFRHHEMWRSTLGGKQEVSVFHPLSSGLMAIHHKMKAAFDPEAILNRNRFYNDKKIKDKV